MTGLIAATAFLVLAGLAWVAWMAVVLFRRPLTVPQNFLLFVDRLLTTFLWRTKSPTRIPLPEGRSCVIMANHRSSIDPFFIQRSTQRPIHWMVAGEYVRHPALRWFLKTCMVIAANRGGVDTAATKTALRILKQGGVVGMFPEGRINRTENLLLPVRPGAALVAIKTRSFVLPCYIEGSPYGGTAASPLFMPAHVTVRYGSPIDTAPYADRIEQGEDDGLVTRELLTTALRGIARLAGQPDYQPQLAGRQWKNGEADLVAEAQANGETN